MRGDGTRCYKAAGPVGGRKATPKNPHKRSCPHRYTMPEDARDITVHSLGGCRCACSYGDDRDIHAVYMKFCPACGAKLRKR